MDLAFEGVNHRGMKRDYDEDDDDDYNDKGDEKTTTTEITTTATNVTIQMSGHCSTDEQHDGLNLKSMF